MFQEISHMNSKDLSNYCKFLVNKHQNHIQKPQFAKKLKSNLYQIKNPETYQNNSNMRFLTVQELNRSSLAEDIKLKYSQVSFRPAKKGNIIQKRDYSNSQKQDATNLEESFITKRVSPKRTHKLSNTKTNTTRKQSFQDMNEQIEFLKSQVNDLAENLKTEQLNDNDRNKKNFALSHYFYLLDEIQYLRDIYLEHYENTCKQPYLRQECGYLRNKFVTHYNNFHINEKNQNGVKNEKI